MKDVMEINNGGKFHIYSICGCEVIHYCEVEVIQIFFAMEYLEEGGVGSLGPNSLEYCSILLKFLPEVVTK